MKKFDKGYLFYQLVRDFFTVLFFSFCLISALYNDVEDSAYLDGEFFGRCLIIFAVIYALKTVYNVLYWQFSRYEIGDTEIKCRRGVLYRKLSVLEYSKIHAINKKQNVIQKIFNIATLSIDSGSANTGYSAEILIIERSATVDRLIGLIREKQAGKPFETPKLLEDPNDNLYEFDSRLKLIYSALMTVLSFFMMFASVVVLAGLIGVAALVYANLGNGGFELLKYFIIAIIAVLVISLISFVFGLIGAHLRFYKFRLYKNENGVTISYGLLSRNTDTFSLKRIKGIVIKQNLIQRLFGFCTVNLEVVGLTFGSEGNENSGNKGSGVLLPLCKMKDVKETLGKILPDYLPDDAVVKPLKLTPFLILKCLIPLFTAVILSLTGGVLYTLYKSGVNFATGFFGIYFAVTAVITAILVLVILIHALLEKHNSGLSFSGDKITAYSGGFTKKCYVIRNENFIALESFTTPMHQKLDAYTYKIHFYTNTLSNEVSVKYLNGDLKESLYEHLNK